MAPAILKRKDLVYPELSFKIIGAFFNVYNQLGYGLNERAYQKAAALEFKKCGLKFQEQLYAPIIYDGEVIDRNFLDYLVEGKVAVELKRGDKFVKAHIDQLYNYLKKIKIRIVNIFCSAQATL